MTYQAKVITGGKVVIPADLRREFGIKDGDSLVFERDDRDNLVLKTRSQVVKEIQAKFRAELGVNDGRSIVDELIAERRAAGAQENREHEEWLRRSNQE